VWLCGSLLKGIVPLLSLVVAMSSVPFGSAQICSDRKWTNAPSRSMTTVQMSLAKLLSRLTMMAQP
jgi:hypothetical protein